MKKFLVGVVLKADRDRVTSVVLDMPDSYSHIDDEPDYGSRFKKLRNAIYEHKKRNNVDGYSEFDKFRPDIIEVISILLIGTAANSGAPTFNAASIMGG